MSATWTATPQQVERVIGAVLPHSSTDTTLPVINSVRIELDGDRFLAVATDRYSLGACRASFSAWEKEATPVEPLTASVSADDVKRLFAFLRPRRQEAAAWTLTPESLTVEVQGGPSLSVPTATNGAENFPDWRSLIGGVVEREPSPGAQMAFTPRIVEHFHKSEKALRESGMVWQFVSHLKPVVVRIGGDFVGLLMPARVSDDMPTLDLGAFGIESTERAA